MSQASFFGPVRRIRSLSVLLLAILFSGLSVQQASAQPDHKPAAAAISESLKNSRTPRQVLSGDAKLVGHLEASTPLHLVFGIAPPRMAEEEKFLKDLQDKKSASFHKYLTAAQWNARFAPSAQDEQAVVDWAQNNGLTVTKRYPNRLTVSVDGSAENVEKAFAVTMNSYQLAGRQEFSNDRDPVIPAHLSGILHSIDGLNSIQRTRPSRGENTVPGTSHYVAGDAGRVSESIHVDGSKSALDAAMKASEEARNTAKMLKGTTEEAALQPQVTSGFIDPTDIYSSYGYDYGALQAQGHCCNPTNNSGSSTPTTSIAIAATGALSSADLQSFQSRYNYLAVYVSPLTVGGTYTCNNTPKLDNNCVETTLDTEWAVATSNSFGSYTTTSHVFLYLAVDNGLGTATTMFQDMLNDGNARVMSSSFGCGEFDCYSSSTMDTDHGIFNSMVGQGWTLLDASDDQGATVDCNAAYGVEYPASDPDVVAVGGTSLALYSDGTFYSETGWQGSTYAGACSQNAGGSGGGCSQKFAAPSYQTTAPACGSGSRSVPDIALNAGYGQNVYFDGAWRGYGGTSMATPMVAGFMAQENSYLLAIGLGGAPLGLVNNKFYYEGQNPSYAPHYPFYDMTSGCNNNDITAANNLGYYCAGTGYDVVTGWGSFNALQLAWEFNTYDLGDFAGPSVNFSGPLSNPSGGYQYFNTNQNVTWTVTDNGTNYPATGVAGFSQAWDNSFSDPSSEASQGTGNSFYSGPQFPNATSGYLSLASAGEGCHYATVDAWDNSGFSSGNQYYYYICYDITAPVTTASLSGYLASGIYANPVTVTLSASDSLSGIAGTAYRVDNGALTGYQAPFTISSNGSHTVYFYSTDKAGNVESTKSLSFIEEYATATKLQTSLETAPQGAAVTFTATVTSSGTTPTGSVKFYDGSTLIGTGTLSGGKTTFTTSSLAVGMHTMSATYQSDSAHYYSTSTMNPEVIKYATTTTVATSGSNVPTGAPVTFTATVGSSGTPATGSVGFKDGNTTIGTGTISSGKATFPTSSLAEGTHSITANYLNDSTHYHSSSSAITQTVKYATTINVSSSAQTAPAGTSVTLTAKVSGGSTPTGTVQFKDGSTVIATKTLSAGSATYTTSSLAVGTHSITVYYESDSTHYHSTSSVFSEVIKYATTTSLAASSTNVPQGTTLTFSSTVTSSGGTPTGSVQFKDGTTTIGTSTLSSGKATFTTSSLSVGTHSITAYYASDSTHYHSTSSVITVTVKNATTVKVVTSNASVVKGTNVTFTATVSGGPTPTGSVQFKDGSTVIGTVTLSSGKAVLSTSTLSVGTHTITAYYESDSTHYHSTSPAISQVIKSS